MLHQDRKHYTIKELSDAYSVTARTLRHYEDQGLLSPKREGQNRIYREADRVRLDWILRGRRVGFSLSEIGEMLDLYHVDDGRMTQRAVTMDRCKDRIKTLKAQRDDINATIKELEGFYALLNDLVMDKPSGKWVSQKTGEPVSTYQPQQPNS